MFKGIVMELKEDYAIVIKEDGAMVRISRKDELIVGNSIFFFEEDIYNKKSSGKVIPFRKYMIPFAAVAALFVILINPVMTRLSPVPANTYAVVTFDINPSIEFELDENGIITMIKGLNDDGSKLNLDGIVGKTFKDGTVILKNVLGENNYLANNNSVLVGFSFLENDDINYEDDILNTIKEIFKGTNVAFLKGQKVDLENAKSQGMSLGKYQALAKLNDENFENAIENLSTQEILDLLKNTDGSIFLNTEQIEELQDEIEDRFEDLKEDDEEDEEDNNDDYDNNDDLDDVEDED